jgi:hypothetical protein
VEECEELDLLRLEGRYLGFIVETHTELNALEHVMRCASCRARVLRSVEDGEDLPAIGSLFQRTHAEEGAPGYEGDPRAFIDARVEWRKGILERLLDEAEAELESLRGRL